MTKVDDLTPIAWKVYQTLSESFQSHVEDLLEISILPSVMIPSGQLFLEEEDNIGITKRMLACAHMIAVRKLMQHKTDLLTSHFRGDSEQEILLATTVLLIFDTEHTTAANFRKKFLLSTLSACRNDLTPPEAFETAVRREYVFLDSILTSPLHRQTKSPTLWHHRRWLYSICTQHAEICSDAFQKQYVGVAVLEKEMAVVMRAGERHRMNYYAWQYARHLVNMLSGLDSTKQDQTVPVAAAGVVLSVLKWCRAHPRDTSGFSFLLWLLAHQDTTTQDERELCVAAVLRDSRMFKWDFESMMEFMTGAIAVLPGLSDDLKHEVAAHVSTVRNANSLSPRIAIS